MLRTTLALVVLCSAASAQDFSPYSDFQAMTLAELGTLQVQVTPQGPQDETLLPVTIVSTTGVIDLEQLVPFQRPGVEYQDEAGTAFRATPEELAALISNAGTLPSVPTGGVADVPRISLLLVNLGKGFEVVLDKSDSTDLFSQARAALTENPAGLLALQDLSCPLGLFGADRPTDVTSEVTVVERGVRLDRDTGLFVGSVDVSNDAEGTLEGPLSLVLIPSDTRVRLANHDGVTCASPPVGARFVNVPIPSDGLPAGAGATATLRFDNPDRVPIDFETRVLSGPGER